MATSTLTYTGELTIMKCPVCDVRYAMPEEHRQRARHDAAVHWYCTNGHYLHYPDARSESVRLRAELDQVKADRDWYAGLARDESERADAERRSNSALRGHLTRWRKRVANGVCPVAGCHRHFPNVQAHVATQHGDWLAEHPEVFEGTE